MSAANRARRMKRQGVKPSTRLFVPEQLSSGSGQQFGSEAEQFQQTISLILANGWSIRRASDFVGIPWDRAWPMYEAWEARHDHPEHRPCSDTCPGHAAAAARGEGQAPLGSILAEYRLARSGGQWRVVERFNETSGATEDD